MRIFLALVSGLLSMASFGAQVAEPGARLTDRENAGLRGPARTLVEQETTPADAEHGLPEITSITTTEYALDGRVLQVRKTNADASEWVKNYTYDQAGRPLRVTSGRRDAIPDFTQVYLYDSAGKLVEVRSGSQENASTRYQYDKSGRKTSTAPALGSREWEGSQLGFERLRGGAITTVYNEQGVAIEGQLRSAEGQLIARVLRTLDSKGRVILEEQIALVPELAWSMGPSQVSYSYDSQGRLAEKVWSSAWGKQVTTTSYNERGDKAEERVTGNALPDDGAVWRVGLGGSIVRSRTPHRTSGLEPCGTIQYSYQYDDHGNWTKRTEVTISRTDPAAEQRGPTSRRELTYY